LKKIYYWRGGGILLSQLKNEKILRGFSSGGEQGGQEVEIYRCGVCFGEKGTHREEKTEGGETFRVNMLGGGREGS